MAVLRCTAKLLKAMKAKPVAEPAAASNRLGEWTANLIRVSRIQLVLAVSEPTRMGVVIDAAPYALIPERFSHTLFEALLYLGIPADMAAEEVDSMHGMELAASSSRSVLGTLNQFAYQIESDLWHGKACSARDLTCRLAEMVVIKPKDVGFPADRVREAFGLAPLDLRHRLKAGPFDTLHCPASHAFHVVLVVCTNGLCLQLLAARALELAWLRSQPARSGRHDPCVAWPLSTSLHGNLPCVVGLSLSIGPGGAEQTIRLQQKRAAQGGPSFLLQRAASAYFSPASLRSASARSVFSHENAVKVLPLASVICSGLRPKWP